MTSNSVWQTFDIVKVPFPFTDRQASKKRPAVILSEKDFNAAAGHSVLAMITSAKQSAWPLDVAIGDLVAAGLPVSSVVRMKLFTLDHRLILGRLGQLAARDQQAVVNALAHLLPCP